MVVFSLTIRTHVFLTYTPALHSNEYNENGSHTPSFVRVKVRFCLWLKLEEYSIWHLFVWEREKCIDVLQLHSTPSRLAVSHSAAWLHDLHPSLIIYKSLPGVCVLGETWILCYDSVFMLLYLNVKTSRFFFLLLFFLIHLKIVIVQCNKIILGYAVCSVMWLEDVCSNSEWFTQDKWLTTLKFWSF